MEETLSPTSAISGFTAVERNENLREETQKEIPAEAGRDHSKRRNRKGRRAKSSRNKASADKGRDGTAKDGPSKKKNKKEKKEEKEKKKKIYQKSLTANHISRKRDPISAVDLVRKFGIRSDGSEESRAFVQQQGFKYHLSGKPGRNNHELSSLSRQMAGHTVLGDADRDKRVVSILHYFGGPRDLAFARLVNDYGAPHGIQILADIAPSTEVRGDACRGLNVRTNYCVAAPIPGHPAGVENLSEVPTGHYDVVSCVDIYYFDEEVLKQLSRISATGIVHCALHRLVGLGGVEHFGGEGIISVDGDPGERMVKKISKTEGVWHRLEDAKPDIVFCPDSSSVCFPIHEDAHELFEPLFTLGKTSFESNQWRQFGFMHVLKICVSVVPGEIFLRDQRTMVQPMVQDLSMSTGVLSRWYDETFNSFVSLLPDDFDYLKKVTNVPVHMEACRRLQSRVQGKSATAFTHALTTVKVQKAIEQEPGMNVFIRKFPDVFDRWVDGTRLAATFEGKRKRVSALLQFHDRGFEVEKDLDRFNKAEFEQERSLLAPIISCLAIFCLILWFGGETFREELLKWRPGTGDFTSSILRHTLRAVRLASARLQSCLYYITTWHPDEFLYSVIAGSAGVLIKTIIEEALSRGFPRTFIGFCSLEFLLGLRLSGDWIVSFVTTVPVVRLEYNDTVVLLCALMHTICFVLPFRDAVFVHFSWNMLVLLIFFGEGKLNGESLANQTLIGQGDFSILAVLLIPMLVVSLIFGIMVWFMQRRSSKSRSLFDRFTESYQFGVDFHEIGIEALPPGACLSCPNLQPPFMEVQDGSLVMQINGIEVEPNEIKQSEQARQASHLLIGTNGALYAVTRSISSFVTALGRIHARPKAWSSDLDVRRVETKKAAANFARTIAGIGPLSEWATARIITISEIVKGYGGRKLRRALKALEDVIVHGKSGKNEMKMHLKSDETLALKVNPDFDPFEESSDMFQKTRVISDPGPKNLVQTVSAAMSLSEWFKKNNFQVRTYFDPDRLIRFSYMYIYCSGMTQRQLSEAMDVMSARIDEIDLIVMCNGDDTVSSIFGHLYEGDFSAMDQSHIGWMLKEGRKIFYSNIGFEDEAEILWEASHGTYRAFMKDGKQKFSAVGVREPQLATGISDTTVWNSITCMLSFVFALAEHLHTTRCGRRPGRPYEDEILYGEHVGADVLAGHFRKLGMTIKLAEKSFVEELTFLKGWWANGRDGYQWIPLISQVLKLGKTLKRPESIYKTDVNTCEKFPDGLWALKAHARQVASTMAHVPRSIPILGAMLESYDRLGLEREYAYRDLAHRGVFENPFKTAHAHDYEVDAESLMTMICRRYGITRAEVMRADKALRTVRSLPVFISDPVFVAIRDVDYGAGGLVSM